MTIEGQKAFARRHAGQRVEIRTGDGIIMAGKRGRISAVTRGDNHQPIIVGFDNMPLMGEEEYDNRNYEILYKGARHGHFFNVNELLLLPNDDNTPIVIKNKNMRIREGLDALDAVEKMLSARGQ